jgi:thiamine-phosphate pyrophosphorylase
MFELIVISDPGMVADEATIIQQLFGEGLACFHLRKPGADEHGVRQLLDAIPAAYHHRIALHGFHHLADEYDIRRLHFTEQLREARMSPPQKGGIQGVDTLPKGSSPWGELKEKGYTLSTSVHDLETLQKLPAVFAYAFFSPVFDSISKQQYAGIAGDGFYLRDEQKPVPVIALGGIDAGNIKTLAAMNFDGAAVLGALWKEPANAVANFKKLCNHHDHTYCR